VLLVHDATGSFALAGAVSAANALAIGLVAPLQGRLIDVLGQTRVLLTCAAGNPLLLGGLVILAAGDAPPAALIACAALSGALMPALSPAMRVLWPRVAGEAQSSTAFALEAILVELYYLFGPLVAVGVSAAATPAAAVVVAGAMTFLGTVGFATSQPSRAWRPQSKRSGGWAGALISPGVRTVALAALPAGIALGALEVALPAFADRRGPAEMGGLLLAAFAVGSTTGGLWYGARVVTRPLGRRWLELNALLALGFLPLALASAMPTMTIACVVAGLALAPLISSSWALIERLAPVGKVTEANTWYHTAVVGGTAFGAASAGVLVDFAPIELALAAPSAALAIAAGYAAFRWRTVAGT
jgi:MFS family permease